MKVQRFLPKERLQSLFDRLSAAGYHIVGPQIRDHAIIFDALDRAEQLPRGIVDEQSPGRYRLHQATDGPAAERYFDWTTGPQAIKPMTFVPRETLWKSLRQDDGSLQFHAMEADVPQTAVIGIRACDLAALAIQDKHFLQGLNPDPHYHKRRESLFLVAVNCMRSVDTCFCSATGDGPEARYGYDLALSELDDGFVIDAHTDRGRAIVEELDTTAASEAQCAQVQDGIADAAKQQKRKLPTGSIPAMLQTGVEHPHWQSLNERCLTCGNCTAVCPTCFCQTHVDEISLDGHEASHVRQWESCFDPDHSYIHGIVIREERPQRYRQWLTHKFGTWVEQFGRSGCVGCGRCIAWCPVGIDVTVELEALSVPPTNASSTTPGGQG